MVAEVTRTGALDMQVCVPKDWSDEQVIRFAEQECHCGTSSGWGIRRQGSKYLLGSDERVDCTQRAGYVHIVLDA